MRGGDVGGKKRIKRDGGAVQKEREGSWMRWQGPFEQKRAKEQGGRGGGGKKVALFPTWSPKSWGNFQSTVGSVSN